MMYPEHDQAVQPVRILLPPGRDAVDPDELTTAQGLELISGIAEAGFKILILSGGEPLMRPDIFQLIEHGRGVGLRVVLGTNGVLITEEIARRLKEAGAARVGISLDHIDPKMHDEWRRMDGAWRPRWRDGQLPQVGLPFQIHTTVTERTEAYHRDDGPRRGSRTAGHHIFFLVQRGVEGHRAESLRPRTMSACWPHPGEAARGGSN